MTNLHALAELLDNAAYKATAVAQLSENGNALSLAEAYEVQACSIDRRLSRGEKVVGVKMAFTSRAKMIQMAVDDLIWGRLTDTMMLSEGCAIDLENYVHPRIEPEVAFRLSRPLSGEVALEQAKAAVEAIAPAMEIIDSRYENFKFSLEDVVADNSSSSGFVTGTWLDPLEDISNVAMDLQFDGETAQQGSSADILGDPYLSLVEAARLAGQAGLVLEAGWIVLAGAATAAEALRPGVNVQLLSKELGGTHIAVAF